MFILRCHEVQPLVSFAGLEEVGLFEELKEVVLFEGLEELVPLWRNRN